MLRKSLAFVVVALLLAAGASAQSVGLVLSGGGAKGLYHIGVIQALEENEIPIDYVAGTSMGSIIAALYAAGYSPEEMRAIVDSGQVREWVSGRIDSRYASYYRQMQDQPSMLTLRLNLRDEEKRSDAKNKSRLVLPSHLISSSQIDLALAELLTPASTASGGDFDRLMVPFRCVASDLVARKPYVLKTGDLGEAVRASATGYTSRYANIGKTSNKGVELSIESRNIVRPKFSWTTNLTIAHNKQNVDDIGSEDFVTALSSPGNNPYMMYGYVKGYPLNALWGFKYGGTWKSVEEFERNSVTNTYVSALAINSDAASRKASLGMPRYYDINNDGSLNNDDLVYQGNADPDLYGGLQNNFRFGRLNVGIYFTYSLGGKIYNYSELYMAGSSMSNQYRYMLEAWHPVRNPQSNLPRAGAVDAHVPSDLMIYDASYIRLKNITVGYTFDLSKRSKFIRDITLNLSAENLHIWKKYNGFDPDVSTDSSDSALRRVDLGAYPKPRTIVFSIQLRY